MTTALFHHPDSLSHAVLPGFPERPERIEAVAARLRTPRFAGLDWRLAPKAAIGTICLAHDSQWVEALIRMSPERGFSQIDADTIMSPGTIGAALHGAGAAVAAVDAVLGGSATNAFCMMRPPGHHAERGRAMGFCFFNSAAIAARHAQAVHGAERVAIVDFDVHHGNGTQDIFWSDPTVLYASTHQMPLYPGTGAAGERGDHDTIVNAPLAPGTDGSAFRAAMTARILPRLAAFRPDLLVVSAGFDAHRRDPLANLAWDEADFMWATEELIAVADGHCGGRIVSVLEGGYDLDGLAGGVAAHVGALLRLPPGEVSEADED